MPTAFGTIGDVLKRFADYPPERIRLVPAPGTATKDDVIEAERLHDKLCELIDGVLVEKTVGFRESLVARRIAQALGIFVDAGKLGQVAVTDGTVELYPGRVRIPDVAFYASEKFPGGQIPDDPIPELVPDLAVEVLSRSNTRGEMFEKRTDFFFSGTRLVWQIDPQTRTVEVFTAIDASTTLTAADTLTGGGVLPGFAVPVADLFG